MVSFSIIRQDEQKRNVADLALKHGISQAAFYN